MLKQTIRALIRPITLNEQTKSFLNFEDKFMDEEGVFAHSLDEASVPWHVEAGS